MATEKPPHHHDVGVVPPFEPPSLHEEGDAQHFPLDRVVFGVAAGLMVAFIAWGVLGTSSLSTVANGAERDHHLGAGWAFVLAASGFVVFVLWLAASRYGRIPLGRDDEQPEFRTVSWIAMMFSAGMGIGLMFYGVGEPLTHFASPPPGTVDAGHARGDATAHGHHAVPLDAAPVGDLRRGRPGHRLRHVPPGTPAAHQRGVRPAVRRRRAEGPVGQASSTSSRSSRPCSGRPPRSASGALQIGSGAADRGGSGDVGNRAPRRRSSPCSRSRSSLSAVSGVAKGIQWLSNINMVLAARARPVRLRRGPDGAHPQPAPDARSAPTSPICRDGRPHRGQRRRRRWRTWLRGWTVFYWAWWISWTPFVGMFIARISRGRTIRQFVGGRAAGAQRGQPAVVRDLRRRRRSSAQRDGVDLAGHVHDRGPAVRVCSTRYPLATVLSVLVDGARGDLLRLRRRRRLDRHGLAVAARHDRARPRGVVIFWGVVMGAVAAIMLLVGGGERRADRAAEPHDHRGAAVRAGDDAAVRGPGQGPARRPDGRRGQRWRSKPWSRPSCSASEHYGDDFFVSVKPHPVSGTGNSSAASEERNGDRPVVHDRAKKATS